MTRNKVGIVKTWLLMAILVPALATIPVLGSCSSQSGAKLKVVTTTSLIAYVVNEVGGSSVSVANIIPPTMCPEDFAPRPEYIRSLLAEADLFLLHEWQEELFPRDLIDSIENPTLSVVSISARIGTNDNWITPPVQLIATDKITEALIGMSSENSDTYRKNAEKYRKQIRNKEAQIRARLEDEELRELTGVQDFTTVNVMCTESIVEFVKWTGLNVAAVYDRPDSQSPQTVDDLADFGRTNSVWLIIDDVQCRSDAGKDIAKALDIPIVILSNFPGGLKYTDTWEQSVDRNIGLIVAGLVECPYC
jgi:ABC-type Zn uptake system ZnuABC Zn-binding protein ZnuA